MAKEKKLVMPKGDGRLDLAVSSLKIYYDSNDWVTNDEFKKAFIALDNNLYNSNTNEAMILHKARTARYFGFIQYVFKAEGGMQGKQGKITESGKRFYESYLFNNKDAMIDTVIDAIINYTFGRNNYSTNESDSDIEPPKVLLKATYEVGYITKEEFIYSMYNLHDLSRSYNDVIYDIKDSRSQGEPLRLPSELPEKEKNHFNNVYGDWKFTQFMREVGILENATDRASLTKLVRTKYAQKIEALSIYNYGQPIEEEITGVIEVGGLSNLPENISHNRIVFGAPGTGKSNLLRAECEQYFNKENYERVTFHPNYSYGQFVGNYKPKPKFRDDKTEYISYEFVPGPFLRIWIKAQNSIKTGNKENFLLIIEEINRANVAAVFGDVFQLLDRNTDGESEYEIGTSEDMREYLINQCGFTPDNVGTIKIPRNMYIWATMNSADQGVMPMDSAFKRRWDFKYIGINQGCSKIAGKLISLNPFGEIEWDMLRRKINDRLTDPDLNINEDKLIGPFFLSDKEINSNLVDDIFKSKVLMYLFEDVLKHRKGKLFKSQLNTFSKVIDAYNNGEEIFDFHISSSIADDYDEESDISFVAEDSQKYS